MVFFFQISLFRTLNVYNYKCIVAPYRETCNKNKYYPYYNSICDFISYYCKVLEYKFKFCLKHSLLYEIKCLLCLNKYM